MPPKPGHADLDSIKRAIVEQQTLRQMRDLYLRVLETETDPVRQVGLIEAIIRGSSYQAVSPEEADSILRAAEREGIDLVELAKASVHSGLRGLLTTILAGRSATPTPRIQELADQIGELPENLMLAAVEAVVEGRIKKKPGPPKGRKNNVPQSGPWTPETLREEMERQNLSLRALAAKFDPPLSDVAIHKWLQKGVPAGRQAELTEILKRAKA